MFNFSKVTYRSKLVTKLLVFCCVALSINAKAALIDIDFIIDGNTYDEAFIVENNSSVGLDIVQFALDLRPNAGNFLCFDEVGSTCHNSGGLDFTAVSGDDVGYLSYDVLDATGGIDEDDFLIVSFNGFESGESFGWKIDIDDQPDGSVFGNDLIGALFLVEMSDGITYQGSLEAVSGNSDAAQLVITGTSSTTIGGAVTPVPEPKFLFAFGAALILMCARRRSFK